MATVEAVRTVVEKPVHAIYTFSVADVFVWRQEQGTLIEQENETEVLRRSNERRTPFKAWPIAPIPGLTTSFTKSWIFLVKLPNFSEDVAFPTLSDRFTIDISKKIVRPEGVYSLVQLPATRVVNPYEKVENLPNDFAAKCAAFKVDVPRSWKNEDGINLELDLMSTLQTACALDDFQGLVLDEQSHQEIIITWDTFSLTYEAELAALRFLVEEKRLEEREASDKSKMAFQMIQNFSEGRRVYYDLHEEFPHLKNPALARHRVPRLILKKFQSFNQDHRAAYDGLRTIPNGLYFVNGCPGAGKTEWNMVLSAMIQSKRRRNSKRRHSPILFVVDLNKTVDDAADRYYTLCRDAGLKLRIIRMHGFPYEMRNSNKLNKSTEANGVDGKEDLDFTKKFLATLSIAKHTKLDRDPNKAPTLDEASWDYYEKHKDYCFLGLKRVLARMDTGEVLNTED